MIPVRLPWRFATVPCAMGAVMLSIVVAPAARAQSQTVPVPTPAPASSLPSYSAPTPASSLPADASPTPQSTEPAAVASPQTATPQSSDVPDATAPGSQQASPAPSVGSTYHDPLETPIHVAPGVAAPPTAVTMPAPAATASFPSIPFETARPVAQRNNHLGSAYIPVDSVVYPMVLRLYSLGYLDSAFLTLRPYTRQSLLHILERSAPDITAGGNDEARGLLARLQEYLAAEAPGVGYTRGNVYGVESLYTRLMGIGGQSLRDSYHIGQTIVNDYGRPYQPGFNNITGFSTLNEYGRFSLFVRGEYQHAPSATGYSTQLATTLSTIDQIPYVGYNVPQVSIPAGPIPAANPFRLQEAVLSYHLLGHEISGGKSDAWLGPGYGSSLAWSNNAEDIYSFRINRIEPMHIPLVDKVLGTLRYDFFVGSLKGHTYPNDPWVHSEMFAFKPTGNFEFGFQRTVIWGGADHEPVTFGTFWKSFYDINDTTGAEKYSTRDPGARFSAFNFSWRLPYVRKYLTLYADSTTHDDVTPVSAPRRAGWRSGLFVTQFPHLPKLDLRVEGVYTDYVTSRSTYGQGNYYETIQRQGYTNQGFLMGDWIGREAKGGQAWLTYHLSPDEWIELEYLNKKNAKDFIPLGTTQNSVKLDVVKRLPHDLQLDAWLQFEHWKAPVYKLGGNNDTVVSFQIKYFPKLHTTPNAAVH